jgi:hypothetical protein
MKLRGYVLVLTLTLLCIVSLASLVHPVQARESISCGALANPVTIDGKWTNADEWKDTFEVTLPFVKGSGEAYFRAKHDQNYLYALVDFVSDATSQANDWGALAIDPSNKAQSTPRTDDFLLIGRWNSPSDFLIGMAWGTGTAWGAPSFGLTGGFKVASSTNVGNDPYSASSHVIYEFQVPMSKLSTAGIGIAAVASDRDVNMGGWPMGPLEEPSNYAYVTFSSQVLPEFPMVTVALPLLFIAAVFVMRYRGRPKEASALAFSPG